MNVPRRESTGEGGLVGPEWLDRRFGRQRGGGETRVEPAISDAEGLEPEAERLRELLQRVQADFINYKRRVEREREEWVKAATKELILKLLPVVDDFGRALEALPEEAADSDWGNGIGLVARKLTAILEEEGVRKMEAVGKDFNPWEHEAVFCEEGPDGEEGKVKAVLRDGYNVGNAVIRPAQVVVSCGKGDARWVAPLDAE